MSLQKYFGTLFVVSFGALILGLAWIQRPSVCTNSKVVEKIDILSDKSSASIGRCRFGDPQAYSPETNELVQGLDNALLPLERFLDNIRPFKSKVVIQVVSDHPYHFKATAGQIELGNKLLEPDFSQRALVKTWLLQGSPDFMGENQLALETLTDVYLFVFRGELNVQNPLTEQVQNVEQIPHWPLTLANLETYCRGAWIVPEHLQTCSQKLKDSSLPANSEVIDWSLRPTLTGIWINTLKSLSLNERKKLLEQWSFAPENLEKYSSIKEIENSLEITFPTTLYEELVVTTRNVLHTLSRWSIMGETVQSKNILVKLQQQISIAGFQDYKSLPRFDFILKIDVPISADDPRLLEMKKISEANPHLNMAVDAGDQIWLLPNMTAVSEKTFSKLYTHRMAYESCHIKFKPLFEMNESTENVLLVKSCHDASVKRYASFINDGIANFALANPNTQFVHLHIPSLVLRQDKLDSNADIYETIGQRDLRDPLFQAFGWESLNWVESYKAYHPKAQIEAIEWFRL